MSDVPSEPGKAAEPGGPRIEDAYELLDGLWRGQILFAGVKLGVFDAVDGTPAPADAIANELTTDPEYTYRLLRALAHYRLLDEHPERRFSITDLGALFRADRPRSARDAVLFDRCAESLSAWMRLPEVVEEGGPSGFVREFGCGFYEYVDRNPEFAAAFNGTMTVQSQRTTGSILDALADYEFGPVEHVCDVGGGHGYFLCRLLERHPHLEGTILERPAVVEASEQHWAPNLGVADRCTYTAGDMFRAVPEADAFFLKFVLHNWSDGECVGILSTIRETAVADDRLFVVEQVVPGPDTPHASKPIDIQMMVMNGSRERTHDEYASLLDRAGWEAVDTWRPSEGSLSVIEASAA